MIYFVATPIGNLEDITLRAIRVLSESDIIYCEDTRTSKKLLDHYEIQTKLVSYHKFNEQKRVEEIIQNSLDKTISIISDAGMPAISDPGNVLIRALIENNIEYTVLPGASAFTTALVLSGFNNESFSFLGFFPTKESEKQKLGNDIINNRSTQIFYESPHRIIKTLEFLSKLIPDRKVAVIREISKMYEDIKIFKAKEYLDFDIVEKGEIVLLIDKDDTEIEITQEYIETKLKELLESGMTKKSAVKKLSEDLGESKNRIYEISLNID